MTIREFIASAGIAFSKAPERVGLNPNMPDSGNMDHWKVYMRCGRSRMSTYFSKGFGHKGEAPTLPEVLDCLASDASSADQYSFEEWCDNLGFNVDSRQAERTYQTVSKQTDKLRKFLGDSAYDTLVNHVERE